MQLYQLKDSIAIIWFLIIILLIYNDYKKIVIILLSLGVIIDIIFVFTKIGKLKLK